LFELFNVAVPSRLTPNCPYPERLEHEVILAQEESLLKSLKQQSSNNSKLSKISQLLV
jgi:hypothetical protein